MKTQDLINPLLKRNSKIMKNQIIDVNEMLDFKHKKGNDEVMYASQLPLKKICFTLSGCYRVYHNGEVVLDCIQPYQAVEKYNSI